MVNVIVVLNYNDWEFTTQFVELFRQFNNIDYIVVVDNHSTDKSLEHLEAITDNKVILLKAKQNCGYSAGNNIGAKFAVESLKADNVIISNPDIKCSESDITEIIRILTNDKKCAVATGLIHSLKADGTYKIFSAYGYNAPNYSNMISNCFISIHTLRKRFLHNSNYLSEDYLKDKKVATVECVPGCFFVIKSSVLREIGFFDESVFLYYEESILGFILKNLGYHASILVDCPVYHMKDPSKKPFKARMKTEKIVLQSAVRYIKKYLKCNKVLTRIYIICFWVGKIETEILNKLFGK